MNKQDAYKYIINPLSNRKVLINGSIGKNILKQYYNVLYSNQFGGQGEYPNSIGRQLWSQDSNSNILKFNCDMNIPVTEGCARFGNKSADPHGITYQKGGSDDEDDNNKDEDVSDLCISKMLPRSQGRKLLEKGDTVFFKHIMGSKKLKQAEIIEIMEIDGSIRAVIKYTKISKNGKEKEEIWPIPLLCSSLLHKDDIPKVKNKRKKSIKKKKEDKNLN